MLGASNGSGAAMCARPCARRDGRQMSSSRIAVAIAGRCPNDGSAAASIADAFAAAVGRVGRGARRISASASRSEPSSKASLPSCDQRRDAVAGDRLRQAARVHGRRGGRCRRRDAADRADRSASRCRRLQAVGEACHGPAVDSAAACGSRALHPTRPERAMRAAVAGPNVGRAECRSWLRSPCTGDGRTHLAVGRHVALCNAPRATRDGH